MQATIIALAALAAPAAASFPSIADIPLTDYPTGSSVQEHAQVDMNGGKALQNYLKGKSYDGSTVVSTDAETAAAALDAYSMGSESSPTITYTVKTSVTAVTTGSWPTSSNYKSFVCTLDGTEVGTLGSSVTGSSKLEADDTVKIYFNANYRSTCGKVTDADIPGVSSATFPFEEGADCPNAAEDDPVVCTLSGDSFTFAVKTATVRTDYGARTLRGFSTAGAAKMDGSKANAGLTACDGTNSGSCNSIKAETDFMAAQSFHGMSDYGDAHVSLAFEALTQQGASAAEGTFSSCQTDASPPVDVPAGATYNLCTLKRTDESDVDSLGNKWISTGNSFVQGSAICKHKITRVPFIPTGATFDLQKTYCENNNGIVSDYFARPRLFNVEVVQKMSIFTNAWMYTIHEFEDAIQDCEGGDVNNNDKGVHAWDEGVAFYTGSLQQAKTTTGYMLYYLANKRCSNFDKCVSSGHSQVNEAILPEFAGGLHATKIGDCATAKVHLDKIKSLMTIPLIQGTLRYAYKVGIYGENPDDGNGSPGKASGEGVAFMMSAVHRLSMCGQSGKADAEYIYNAMYNLKVTTPAFDFDGDGEGDATFAGIKQAFERHYTCLGITCADVGGLASSVAAHNGFYPGAEACVDPDPEDSASDAGTDDTTATNDIPDWALGVIGGAAFLVLVFFGMMCGYKSSKDATVKMYNDLKKEGMMGKV